MGPDGPTSHPKSVAKERKLTFPIKLRCSSVEDLRKEPTLEDALARALSRAFAKARRALPAIATTGDGVVLWPPELKSDRLSGADAALVMTRVQRAIAAAARRAGVTVAGTNAGAVAKVVPFEKFDRSRYEGWTGLYEVASYDPIAKGNKAQIPLGQNPPATPDWAAVMDALRDPDEFTASRAFYDIRDRILAWDKYAVAVAMTGLHADGSAPTFLVMRALRNLAQQNPRRFRALLRELRASYEGIHAATIARSENDVEIVPYAGADVPTIRGLEDILGGLVYVAQELPEARPVAAEWEASASGLNRISALVRALAETRAKLINYLLAPFGDPFHHEYGQPRPLVPVNAPKGNFERTDPGVMGEIYSSTIALLRYQGATLIQAHQSGQQDFAYQLQLDLIENIRLIDATLTQVQKVDGLIQALVGIYGDAAGRLEETRVLREIRADLLRQIAGLGLPTATRAMKIREEQEAQVANWAVTAADRRLTDLREHLNKLIRNVGSAPILVEVRSPELAQSLDDFFSYELKLKADLEALKQSTLRAPMHDPDQSKYLDALAELEWCGTLATARLGVIRVWINAVKVQRDVLENDIGSSSERQKWLKTVTAVNMEAKQLCDQLRAATASDQASITAVLASLPDWAMSVRGRLEVVVDMIKDTQRRENNIRVLMLIGGLIAVAITGGALAAFEVGGLTVVVGEAATMTGMSVATSVALERPIKWGQVGQEFVTNFITIGSFRIFNKGIALIAGTRNGFSQLAAFAGNAAIVAAPALLTAIENRQWTDGTTALLVGSVLAHIVCSALLNQSPGLVDEKTLSQLRALGIAADGIAEMSALQAENAALGTEWKSAVTTGRLDEEKAASLQRRAVRVADRSASAARRLASGLTDDQLASLKLPSRAGLLAWADRISAYGAALEATPNPAAPVLRALPPPADVFPEGALTVIGDTIQYNPRSAGTHPADLVNRLRGVGYTVTEQAGVIRLLGPGESAPRYLLLPAGSDLPSPVLARLVTPPGRGAAQVLQRSPSNIARGLRRVQEQNAVPSLEGTLTSLAAKDEAAAARLLIGIGRHVPPGEVRAIQGIARFLDVGGNPRTLAVAMGVGEKTWSPEVLATLAKFATFYEDDAKAVDVIVKVRGEHAAGTDSIAGIGANYPEPGQIYKTIAAVEPQTERGLDQLIRQLASGEQAARLEALGVLNEARAIAGQSGAARLEFSRRTAYGAKALAVRDLAAAPAASTRGQRPPSVVPPAGGGLITPVSQNMNIDGTTAGTGGISAISGFRRPDGSQVITIEGRVLPTIVRQGFEEGFVHGSDLGLAKYHLAHGWGPVLGDEARAGIWLAPESVNLSQQKIIELQLQGLAAIAASKNGQVYLRITESTHPPARLPANLRAHDFLSEIKYEFTVDIPGTPPVRGEVIIHVSAPPNGRVEVVGASAFDALIKLP